MAKKSIKNQKPAKPKRPMGVWSLTAYSLLTAGLLPVLIAVNSMITKDDSAGLYTLLFSLLLGAAVILLSIGAWQGKETARKLYLVAVSVHWVMMVVNNVMLINSGLPAAAEIRTLWQQILLSVVLLVTNWVYFNLRMVKKFYQPAEINS